MSIAVGPQQGRKVFTLQRWYDPHPVRTLGFYVQDVRYAAGAGIGVKHSGRWLEFHVGPSESHDFLSQKLVGWVVP